MKYGSLFSGVGGFDLGLDAAGWRCAWQVEKDRQARAVLRRHWSDVPKHEDVCDVGADQLEPVDLICGGFPCQDLSVAGRRAGLDGERSGLFHEFMRIARELAPRWLLLENVPGLLSSNEGRDMGTVVGTLAELGYGWTYRVLDAQYFGVAQRRRRVFIVARAGGVCPPEVLFEPEGLPWNPAPGEEAGEVTAALPASGAGTARTGNERTEASFVAVHSETASPLDTKPYADHESKEARIVMQCHGSNVGPMGHLRAGNGGVTGGVPFTAYHIDRDKNAHEGRAGTIQSHGSGGCEEVVYAIQERACAESLSSGPRGKGYRPDKAYTIEARHQPQSVSRAIPRRLTPRECERLMGWPDDWTAWGVNDDGEREEMADGPRYRMCGNGVVGTVSAWIGRRIIEADAATEDAA